MIVLGLPMDHILCPNPARLVRCGKGTLIHLSKSVSLLIKKSYKNIFQSDPFAIWSDIYIHLYTSVNIYIYIQVPVLERTNSLATNFHRQNIRRCFQRQKIVTKWSIRIWTIHTRSCLYICISLPIHKYRIYNYANFLVQQ